MEQLDQQRSRILQQIERLGPMRMGTVYDHVLNTQRADGSITQRGPYPTYTFKRQGRTVCVQLRSREQAETYRRQIENFRRYQELSAQLVQVSQRLADLEARTAAEEGKKNSRNWSKPNRKSRRRG